MDECDLLVYTMDRMTILKEGLVAEYLTRGYCQFQWYFYKEKDRDITYLEGKALPSMPPIRLCELLLTENGVKIRRLVRGPI